MVSPKQSKAKIAGRIVLQNQRSTLLRICSWLPLSLHDRIYSSATPRAPLARPLSPVAAPSAPPPRCRRPRRLHPSPRPTSGFVTPWSPSHGGRSRHLQPPLRPRRGLCGDPGALSAPSIVLLEPFLLQPHRPPFLWWFGFFCTLLVLSKRPFISFFVTVNYKGKSKYV